MIKRTYRICVNCVHLKYEEMWKQLKDHKSGRKEFTCGKDKQTYDLAKACQHFKKKEGLI
jgi:hypothetical protein